MNPGFPQVAGLIPTDSTCFVHANLGFLHALYTGFPPNQAVFSTAVFPVFPQERPWFSTAFSHFFHQFEAFYPRDSAESPQVVHGFSTYLHRISLYMVILTFIDTCGVYDTAGVIGDSAHNMHPWSGLCTSEQVGLYTGREERRAIQYSFRDRAISRRFLASARSDRFWRLRLAVSA